MADLIQEVPLTDSDDKQHVLDASCWCCPTASADRLIHHPDSQALARLRHPSRPGAPA